MVLKISPTVLMISHHIYNDIPMVLNVPHGTQDIHPHASRYPPTVLKTHHTGWL